LFFLLSLNEDNLLTNFLLNNNQMTNKTFMIKSVKAREILDSRAVPTVEVTVEIDDMVGMAMVPSGASTGIHEALELRDGDKNRYQGLGVLKAVENINEEINNNIVGKEFNQKELDDFLIKLDGTENKSRLGANAILGVSMAFARANAKKNEIELYEYLGNIVDDKNFNIPQPLFNIINGGKHADSGLDIQEFMLVPADFPTITKKIQVGSEIIHTLKNILIKSGQIASVGDEGGFAPKLKSNEEALDLMVEAIKEAGYDTNQIKIGMDCAASSFYENGIYKLKIDGQIKELNASELIDWYEELINKYPIMLIEDGLAEDDWEGFALMTKRLGERIKVVGDDLLVTNIKRIGKAIESNSVNSVLIKLNQIGTVSETIEAIVMTKKQGWLPFVSHRSGETIDTFIADLSVGLNCPLIKSGSLIRGERVCKYNRLMEIEEELK
jgi:enolase